MSRRVIIMGSAVVALAAVGAWWIVRAQSTEHTASAGSRLPVASTLTNESKVTGPVTAEVTTGGDAGGAQACEFTPGQTFSFAYTSTTAYELGHDALGVRAPDGSLHNSTGLSASLSFEVLEAGPTATLVGRLSGVSDGVVDALGAAIEHPLMARVDSRCKVVGFARLATTPDRAARAQQVVLHDLSFVVPRTATAPQREVFATGTGLLEALVRIVDNGVEREALRYQRYWSERMTAMHLTRGTMTVQRGASAWLHSLRSVETLEGGPMNQATTTLRIDEAVARPNDLREVSRDQSDYQWVDLLPQQPSTQVARQGGDSDHRRRVKAMQQVSYATAVAHFKDLLHGGANINEQWRDMAASLDAHPEAIDDYVNMITAESFPAGWRGPAFLALSQAQTPRARDALLEVFRSPRARPDDRVRSSLGLVTRADTASKDFALELEKTALDDSDDADASYVGTQAALHLGVLAGLHPQQQELGEVARGLVREMEASVSKREHYMVLFGTMGNMADPRLLPEIEDWSQNPDVKIRELAPRALRRYPPARVHDFLVEWLQREGSPDVMRELFNVIHHMYIDAGRPVSDAIKAEALKHLARQPLVLTRQSLIRILAPFVQDDPQVRRALRAQARIEFEKRSGLYTLLTQTLPPEDVDYVLSTLPGLGDQFGQLPDPMEVDTPREVEPDLPTNMPGFDPRELGADLPPRAGGQP